MAVGTRASRALGPAGGTTRLRSLGLAGLGVLLVLGSGCSIPRWPAVGPVSSDFGLRFRGLLPEVHRGVDISVPAGTGVRPMAPGRVRFQGTMAGYGRVVWLDHGGGVLSIYAHLSEILVSTGEVVDRGRVIGRSGASGNATAPHLHFEVWRWGRPRDPVPLLGGAPR